MRWSCSGKWRIFTPSKEIKIRLGAMKLKVGNLCAAIGQVAGREKMPTKIESGV